MEITSSNSLKEMKITPIMRLEMGQSTTDNCLANTIILFSISHFYKLLTKAAYYKMACLISSLIYGPVRKNVS